MERAKTYKLIIVALMALCATLALWHPRPRAAEAPGPWVVTLENVGPGNLHVDTFKVVGEEIWILGTEGQMYLFVFDRRSGRLQGKYDINNHASTLFR